MSEPLTPEMKKTLTSIQHAYGDSKLSKAIEAALKRLDDLEKAAPPAPTPSILEWRPVRLRARGKVRDRLVTLELTQGRAGKWSAQAFRVEDPKPGRIQTERFICKLVRNTREEAEQSLIMKVIDTLAQEETP